MTQQIEIINYGLPGFIMEIEKAVLLGYRVRDSEPPEQIGVYGAYCVTLFKEASGDCALLKEEQEEQDGHLAIATFSVPVKKPMGRPKHVN